LSYSLLATSKTKNTKSVDHYRQTPPPVASIT